MHHPTEKYISAITDALIRIAEHPEKRKKYSFVIQTGERTDECFFYKNDPMISCAEQFGLAHCYALEITPESTYEDMLESYDLAIKQILDISSFQDRGAAVCCLSLHMREFFEKNEDIEGVMGSMEQSLEGAIHMVDGVGLYKIKELKEIYMHFPERSDAVNLISKVEHYYSTLPEEYNEDDLYNYIVKACEDCKFIGQNRWLATALLQAYGLIELPKPQRAKKNSFDQLYLDAENGDKESRRKLADAYRNGIGVRANARLADWWDQWK